MHRWAGLMRGLGFRFAVVALVLLSVYGAVSQTAWFERGVVEPHLEFVARGTGLFLRALGQPATVEGPIVQTPTFALKTARGCDAIGAAVIVCSLILAFPARARSKLTGAVACTAILVGVNFLRTTSLALIGSHYRSLFDLAHRDVWQIAFALLSVGLFVSWIRISAAASETHRADVAG